MSKTKKEVIFSINVHEKLDFLLKQIENISDFVSVDYVIVINPNALMYNTLRNCTAIKSNDKVVLNDNHLEKRRHHGSLTHGFYLNMQLALEQYDFDYFIILSSRNLFYNKLSETKLFRKTDNRIDVSFALRDPMEHRNIFVDEALYAETINFEKWQWKSFVGTELSKYIIQNKLWFARSPHEGLTFTELACKSISCFLDVNKDIRSNLFNWGTCVEEYALQTICINTVGYFHNIGVWAIGHDSDNVSSLPNNKLIYKTTRT